MQVRVRKTNPDGQVRLESSGEVIEVLINEDIMHPKKETVSVCFRGRNSSGIIDFTPKELEKLYASARGRMHLVRSVKKIVAEKGTLI